MKERTQYELLVYLCIGILVEMYGNMNSILRYIPLLIIFISISFLSTGYYKNDSRNYR